MFCWDRICLRKYERRTPPASLCYMRDPWLIVGLGHHDISCRTPPNAACPTYTYKKQSNKPRAVLRFLDVVPRNSGARARHEEECAIDRWRRRRRSGGIRGGEEKKASCHQCSQSRCDKPNGLNLGNKTFAGGGLAPMHHRTIWLIDRIGPPRGLFSAPPRHS